MRKHKWLIVALVLVLILFLAPLALMAMVSPRTPEAASSRVQASDLVPEQYRDLVNAAGAVCEGVTPGLIAAQIAQESGWNPTVTSPVGASGIAQFMPTTWAAVGRDHNGDGVADVNDPADAIPTQAQYMCDQLTQVQGYISSGRIQGDPIALTLAAYNAGIGNVLKAGGIPGFSETQNYVRSIMEAAPRYEVAVTAPAGGAVGSGGWALPASGRITSPFGPRRHPRLGYVRNHNGVDLSDGQCGAPIWAAHDGTVTGTGTDNEGNGFITITHEEGIETAYLHMYPKDIQVSAGQAVQTGQVIAAVGSSGNSTGCHLHFGVKVNGQWQDPVPFMAERGITLGTLTSTPVIVGATTSSAGDTSAAVAQALEWAKGIAADDSYAYIWGGTGNGGYDCSGLSQAFLAKLGITVAHFADTQASDPQGTPVASIDQAKPGDLLFWGTGGYYHHVAIYAGDGMMVSADNPRRGINYEPIRDGITHIARFV